MNNFWDYTFLKNSVQEWVIALSIILICIVVLRLFQTLVIKRIKSFTAKTKTTVDDFIFDVIGKSVMPLLFVLSFYVGFRFLNMDPVVKKVVRVAIMVVVLFFLLQIVNAFIRYLFKQLVSGGGEDLQREKQTKGIVLIIQSIVWVIGFLFFINNLGYNITTLIAGLGIGGIAIALAAQTILGDLFSYFVIFFDKPFEIGDFIIMDDKKGTIEYIGIKTTRLKTLGGEQLICSNTDLTNSRVHNYKRMIERRISFSFGVLYSTPAAKIKVIPQYVKSIVESMQDVRFDRAHFKEFGDFSLNFEVVFYVLSPDFNVYMDKQQEINLQLYEVFEKDNIGFAFPTQTIYLNKINDEEVATKANDVNSFRDNSK